MSNSVVRWQIVSPDAPATADFYSSLFDWTVGQNNELGYREITAGREGIDGGVWPAPQADRPFVQLFVEVESVEKHVARAQDLGARVIVPVSTLPDGDVMAVLADPQGMPFVLCTLKPDE